MEKGRAEIILDRLRNCIQDAQNVPLSSGKAMINRDEVLFLIDSLEDILADELRVYREVTDKRAKILTDARKEAEEIVQEAEKNASRIRVTKRREDEVPGFKQSDLSKPEKMALRTASDIYAASLIYTDEMLTEVDHLISNAYDTIEQEYQRVQQILKKKITGISENKAELMSNLNELSKNDRYSQILEISQLLANELYHEREKARSREKEKEYQLEIQFDEEGKPEQAEDRSVPAKKQEEKTKKRPPINPDRTEVKIELKKPKEPGIKVMPRESKNVVKKDLVIVDESVEEKDGANGD